MPILVKCECGHEITVADGMAGKKGRCPECDAILAIPAKSERRSRGGAHAPAPTRDRLRPPRALGFLIGLLMVTGLVGLFALAFTGVFTGVQVVSGAGAFKDYLGIFEGYRDAARESSTVTGILFMLAGLGLGTLWFVLFTSTAQLLRLFLGIERSLTSIADHLTRRN